MNTEGYYPLPKPFVQEDSELGFLTCWLRAWLLVLLHLGDTGVAEVVSTATGEVWFPSNKVAHFAPKFFRNWAHKFAFVSPSLIRGSHLEKMVFSELF